MLITTSTNATTPGALPEGSFVRATLAPGPNVVVIDVKAGGGYVGQLAVKVAYGGDDGDLRTWPGEAVADATGAFGPGASATGAWFTTIPGPGYVYVVATALTSGQPDVTLRSGPGSQAGGNSTGALALDSIIDNDGGTKPVYICEAAPGTPSSAAAWRIRRLNYVNGTYVGATWAGTGAFDQVADNRGNLFS